MSVESLVKPWIAKLDPYQPGKPIEELERELGIRGAIKLASNENPLGPSPRAIAALQGALGEMHRYPDGASHRLRQALARKLGVDPEMLVFGAGADEVLELLAKTLLGPGDEVVHAWPSFAMYPIVVTGMGARGIAVPLDAALAHDLDAMREAVSPRTKLVFVCNPNNPTGTSVGAAAFDRFVESLPAHVVLAVDEAYVEFARRGDFPRTLDWLRRRPGTIVLRTFSKIYGLAGLRVGYGAGDPDLVSYLERARHPFNVSLAAQIAAEAALDDDAFVARSRANNADGIAYLERELAALGLATTPTDANFVLVRARGRDTYERLLRLGVIVRPLGGFGLLEHVRITVGTAEENARLVDALRHLRAEGAL